MHDDCFSDRGGTLRLTINLTPVILGVFSGWEHGLFATIDAGVVVLHFLASAVCICRIYGGVALWLAACVGCGQAGPQAEVPALDPSAATALALADYDSDGDGSIDAAELEKSPALKSALALIDTDKDSAVAAMEIQNRIASLRAANLPLLPFSCEVLLDGRPLAEAEVRLVPEKFMGAAVKAASGKTNAAGWASPNVEGEPLLQGVHLGFFRVEISKKNAAGEETVPSRYNRESILGQLVALDVPDLDHGITYRLSSK
jgi:hypothetical protein